MVLWACCVCQGQWARVRESARKPVGKPDAGNPHVRFDERGLGNGTALGVSTRAQPRLYRRLFVCNIKFKSKRRIETRPGTHECVRHNTRNGQFPDTIQTTSTALPIIVPGSLSESTVPTKR